MAHAASATTVATAAAAAVVNVQGAASTAIATSTSGSHLRNSQNPSPSRSPKTKIKANIIHHRKRCQIISYLSLSLTLYRSHWNCSKLSKFCNQTRLLYFFAHLLLRPSNFTHADFSPKLNFCCLSRLLLPLLLRRFLRLGSI